MKTIPVTSLLLCISAANAEELTTRQQEGKKLFEATCNFCHNPRGWAADRLRMRLDESRVVIAERTDLDRDYIRFVVRNGLVNMPAYTPTDLSDIQIQLVADYLTRDNGKGAR
ncbi:MAG TPA: cytochrome c [Steroidobacteraceae bacterium]|nr:cytochrome c [Steroidobacteraceae bacterium]